MTILRSSSTWSQAGAVPVQMIAALSVAAALVAAYWGVYTTGSKAGANTVKQQWDRDTASRAIRTAEQTMKHMQAERALQAHAAEQRKQKNAEINRIAAVHAAELDSLRNRPDMRAHDRPGEPASPTESGVGCTGAGLAKPDAAFLAGYAADAERLATDYKRCTALYDAAERALSSQAGQHKNQP